MNTYAFLGMSLRGDISADDRYNLAMLDIATLHTEDGTWYVFPKNKIQSATLEFNPPATGLFAHDYHRYINQLKRVKKHIYMAYNDDFGFHKKTGSIF